MRNWFQKQIEGRFQKMPMVVDLFLLALPLGWLWVRVNIQFNRANVRGVVRGVVKEEMQTAFTLLCSLFIWVAA